jgi:hypothetical protein
VKGAYLLFIAIGALLGTALDHHWVSPGFVLSCCFVWFSLLVHYCRLDIHITKEKV